MQPTNKPPGKRIIRRAMKPKKWRVKEYKQAEKLSDFYVEYGHVERSPVLKKFLQKRRMGKRWRDALSMRVFRLSQNVHKRVWYEPPEYAITPKEQAAILKDVRRFFAAIKEAETQALPKVKG